MACIGRNFVLSERLKKMKFIQTYILATLVGLATWLVMPAIVSADSKNNSGWYGNISGGAFMPTDTDFSAAVNDSAFGVTVNAAITADISSETGHAVFGTIGKKLNNFFSVEGSLGYVKAELDDASFEAAVTLTSGGSNLAITAGGVAELDGDINAVNGKVNLIFHPLDNKKFTPYVGGGVGFAAWEANLDSVTFNATTLTVNGSEDGTDMTAEAIVGLDAAVSDSVTLGGRYTYLWTDTGTAFTDDVTAHMVKLNVGIKF